MTNAVPPPPSSTSHEATSLRAQLDLAAAARAASRAATRKTVRPVYFEGRDPLPALQAREAFRAATLILGTARSEVAR